MPQRRLLVRDSGSRAALGLTGADWPSRSEGSWTDWADLTYLTDDRHGLIEIVLAWLWRGLPSVLAFTLAAAGWARAQAKIQGVVLGVSPMTAGAVRGMLIVRVVHQHTV